jgi:hypothetical protein
LIQELLKSLAALTGVSPIAIERGLGAAVERDGNPCVLCDHFHGDVGELGCEHDDLACGVTEEIDRVLNSACPF